jgi:hypothetical protein
MQFETEGASVDLACSNLDQTPNVRIERTACQVTGQAEGMTIGVRISGIEVEAHLSDGMPTGRLIGGCK